jgi:hypothetical protein
MNNVFFSAYSELELVGAAACRIAPGSEMALFECQHDQARARRLMEKRIPLIIVSSAIINVLSGGELAAVIAHEAGHVAHGHVEKMEEAGATGISLELQPEFGADAYAAERCGAAAMISALTKLVAHLKVKVSEMTNNDVGVMMSFEKEMVEKLNPRLDALRAML